MTMLIETYPLGPLQTNTYLLADESTGRCAVIDPGFDSEFLIDRIEKSGWKVDWILNTHAHFDHVFNNAVFVERTRAPLAIHEDDLSLLDGLEDQLAIFGFPMNRSPRPDRLLQEGDTIQVGDLELAVLHTPGHSPGGVTFVVQDVAFVGDALFSGSVGRTDLPGGDHDQLIQAIRTRLLTLPDSTRVLSGHGPETSIGLERRTNPFLV